MELEKEKVKDVSGDGAETKKFMNEIIDFCILTEL